MICRAAAPRSSKPDRSSASANVELPLESLLPSFPDRNAADTPQASASVWRRISDPWIASASLSTFPVPLFPISALKYRV